LNYWSSDEFASDCRGRLRPVEKKPNETTPDGAALLQMLAAARGAARHPPPASRPGAHKLPAHPARPQQKTSAANADALRAARNTLAAYGTDLDNLQTFLARRKQKPATANTDALRAYLKALDYVGMTPRTVARRLSVMRQFFRFLLAERLRGDDPAVSLDSP